MPITAICFDTETTGVRPGEDEILELSIVDQDGNALYHGYFNPEYHSQWPGAEAVNGISPAFVADKPHISACLAELQAIFDTPELTTLIGYNTCFDIRMLEAAGIVIPARLEIVDVMREFAPIYGDFSEKYGSYKWKKLIECAEYYHYNWTDRAHDSLADALATLYCYRKMHDIL